MRDGRHRAPALAGAGAPRPLPLLGLGRPRQARRGALGGERRRLALALVVASGANFLVLDEPTNHLDLESREALEAALEAFPGTVLLVSHDRAVLDAVAERIVAVESGPALLRRRLADYARIRGDETRRPAPPPRGKEKPRQAKARPRPSELEAIEASIQAREPELAELERRLVDDWGTASARGAHCRTRGPAALLERWEQSSNPRNRCHRRCPAA